MSDIRAYNNPLKPSYGERWQNERLSGAIYTEGKSDHAWRKLRQSLRKSGIIQVVHLFLIGPTRGPLKKRRAEMLARIRYVRRRGYVIVETATGRRSDKADDWDAMLVEGRESLGKSHRVKGTGKTGAPSKIARAAERMGIPEAELREKCLALWQSRRFKTRVESANAIGALLGFRVRPNFCYSNFGRPDKPK